MSTTPHRDSFFHFHDRVVELKVHRCLWSGTYSENSPLAIEECAREAVVRVEVDVQLLRDGPRNVTEIAELLKTSVVNASHHLTVLRHARLVRNERRPIDRGQNQPPQSSEKTRRARPRESPEKTGR